MSSSAQMTSLVSVIVSSLAALASMVAVGIALLVFRETRRIRELEWVYNANLAWNDFNRMLLDDDIRSLWMDFLFSDGDSYNSFKFDNKVNWVLYCHLNILVTSMHARRFKGPKEAFFKDILEAEFKVLWKRREYVRSAMIETGYDFQVNRYFNNYCIQVDALIKQGETPRTAFERIKGINWLI